jgi:hypothetical protein
MDGNPGVYKVSERMSDKDNCGVTGTKELNIFPTKCKAFIFDMGISTARVLLSNEVGELATKYKAWHKLTADESQSAGRPDFQITTGCARTLLKCGTKSKINSRLKMGQVTRNQDGAYQACLRLWIQGTRKMHCKGHMLEAQG